MDQNIQPINSFDKAIFEKMSKLESPLGKDSWDVFSKKLDAELPTEIESTFDSSIKTAVNKPTKSVASMAGWDALSRMLDNDPILGNTPENIADHAIRSKLNYSEPTYNALHWEQLSNRLDIHDDRKIKVVLLKSIELAMVLIVIMTAFNYYKPIQLFETNRTNPYDTKQNKSKQKVDKANKNIPMAGLYDPYRNNQVLSDEYNSENFILQTSYDEDNSGNIDPEQYRNSFVSSFANCPVASVGLLNNSNNLDIQRVDDQNILLPTILVQHNNLKNIRIGVQSKLDLNNVTTPAELASNEPYFNRNVWGYGAGVAVSYGKKNWEIESGLNYSKKKYNTSTTVLKNNNPRAAYESYAIKSVNMDVVELPVNVRYTFAKKGKLKFYANAGVSANVALANNFVRDEYYPLIDPLEPRLASTNLIKGGLLNGESLNKNLYITTNVGAGMEYALSNKHSIFVQGAYQQYLSDKGLGPKNDKINSFAINAGARVTL